MEKPLRTSIKLIDGLVVATGEISFSNAKRIHKITSKFIEDNSKLTFDFANIVIRDISALALLVGLTRYAKQKKKTINFVNLPPQLLDMAKITGVLELLPIKKL